MPLKKLIIGLVVVTLTGGILNALFVHDIPSFTTLWPSTRAWLDQQDLDEHEQVAKEWKKQLQTNVRGVSIRPDTPSPMSTRF